MSTWQILSQHLSISFSGTAWAQVRRAREPGQPDAICMTAGQPFREANAMQADHVPVTAGIYQIRA